MHVCFYLRHKLKFLILSHMSYCVTCCMCFNIQIEGFHNSFFLFGVGVYISALEHCRKMKCSTFCGVLYSLYTRGFISGLENDGEV